MFENVKLVFNIYEKVCKFYEFISKITEYLETFNLTWKTIIVNIIIPLLLVLIRYIVLINIGGGYKVSFDYEWTKYKMEYSKSYGTFIEESRHYEVFQKNLKEINVHNGKYEAGVVMWSMGINQFSDIPNNKRHKCKDVYYISDDIEKEQKEHELKDKTPDSIDWRDFDAVMPVRNQLSCCSSYAMATVGAIESHYAIQYKKKHILSPQELIDCSVPYKNEKCEGGNVTSSFNYVIDKGLGRETDYPYRSKPGKCEPTKPVVNVTGFAVVPSNEQYLLNAVGTVGPVVAMISTDKILRYKSGIFDCSSGWGRFNQAVLLVGYGKARGISYWLIKMSWGPKWGEEGYLRLRRNTKKSQCGLFTNMKPVYPILGPMK